jgi:hypothetical protein
MPKSSRNYLTLKVMVFKNEDFIVEFVLFEEY